MKFNLFTRILLLCVCFILIHGGLIEMGFDAILLLLLSFFVSLSLSFSLCT